MTGSGRKMRVLFAIGRMSPGGAEKLLVHQLATLDRARFEPFLITIFDEQDNSLADRVRIDRCFHFHSTFDAPAFLRLYRYVQRGQFDAIVTHLFSANFLARLAAIVARVPVIVSYEHNVYPNKHRWQIVADRLLSRKTDLIIASSDAAKTSAAQQASIPQSKFLIMHIPPLLERRPPKDQDAIRRSFAIPATAPVVLTVSRLVTDKGHAYLVDAAPRVLAQYPDVRFLLVGWGPLRDELQMRAKHAGVGENVILPGAADIADVLPLAAVYVDPSVSTDLPVAIMEAMHGGKAIVATNVGDIPLFVRDGVTGIIVEPRDPIALARAIVRLLADESLRDRLGDAAREEIRPLSLEQYDRQFAAALEQLFSRKQAILGRQI